MYNLSRFNLYRLNQPLVQEESEYTAAMQESFSTAIGYGEDSYLTDTASAIFQAKTVVDSGEMLIDCAGVSVMPAITLVADQKLMAVADETVASRLWLSLNSFLVKCVKEAIATVIETSSNVQHQFNADCAFHSILTLGEEFYLAPTLMYVILDADISSGHLVNYLTQLQVTLPPGASLVLDSENFVMLQNGENVIHLHRGAWPSFCRDTYDIQVQSALSAPLEKTLIYRELYL